MALLETAGQLSSAQLRGSAELPSLLPVGRFGGAFLTDRATVSAGARRALVIAAASSGPAAGQVVAALRSEGVDAEAVLAEAEQANLLALTRGTLTFRHPLIRAAAWQQASAGERRSAHAALAEVLPDGPAALAAPGRSCSSDSTTR